MIISSMPCQIHYVSSTLQYLHVSLVLKEFCATKYPARSTARESSRESPCHNRQLCGLSADSLALSFIQCRYVVKFLCIVCPVYGVCV